jgi:hypothetical protein
LIACAQAVGHNKSVEDSLWVTAHALEVWDVVVVVVVVVVIVVVIWDIVLSDCIVVVHVPSRHRTRAGLSGMVGMLRADHLLVLCLLELRLRV